MRRIEKVLTPEWTDGAKLRDLVVVVGGPRVPRLGGLTGKAGGAGYHPIWLNGNVSRLKDCLLDCTYHNNEKRLFLKHSAIELMPWYA